LFVLQAIDFLAKEVAGPIIDFGIKNDLLGLTHLALNLKIGTDKLV